MFKRLFLVAFAIFGLTCCANKVEELSGTDGLDIPPAFSNFPDVPFPKRAQLNLTETKAFGSGENWIGTVSYTTPYDASRIFDFYIAEMPKLQWTEVAVVRAAISQMTYFKDNKALQILIESNGDNQAKITVTAVPNQTAMSRYNI